MRYTVELSDVDGNACKVALSLPVLKVDTDKTNSTWRTLDKGWIKYNSGGCSAWGPVFHSGNLSLLIGDGWIVDLMEFLDWKNTVNDSGAGLIDQSACVGFKPGKITWALLE
jgi:hypothetical protein